MMQEVPGATENMCEDRSVPVLPMDRSRTHPGSLTPTTVGTLQGRSHNFGVTGAIEGVIHAPIRHGTSNMFLNRLLNGLGIDTVRGSQSFGCFKLLRVGVYGNDSRRPRHFCALDHSKALERRNR